jgi:hypothetical protein
MAKVKNGWRLRCRVGRGMFESERTVMIALASGQISAIVDADDVEVAEAPAGETLVDGWVRVTFIEKGPTEALIDLPRETFTSGPRILVPLTMLQDQRSVTGKR